MTTLNSNALVTLTDVREAMGLDILETKDDNFIIGLINRYSTRIETYCKRVFHAGLYTEYYDGDGLRGEVFVENPPIISVSGLWDDVSGHGPTDTVNYQQGTEITPDLYVIEQNEAGTIRLANQSNILANPSNYFLFGINNIKVIYSGGYTTVPEDLKDACIEMVVGAYRKFKDKLIGLSSKSSAGGSIVPDSKDMSDSIKSILAGYRRFIF